MMQKNPFVAFLIVLSVVLSGCLNGGDDSTDEDTNKAPVAQIESVIPNPAYAGQTVTFSASGSDEDGFVVDYLWGSSMDGEISTDQQFSTNTLSVGEHTVYLKVIDDEGKSSSKEDLALTILPENHAPVGNINASGDTEQINFTAENISDPDGDELSYNWDFGDGNTSSDMETQHNYSQTGVYDVILVVSDGKNFNGTSLFNITLDIALPLFSDPSDPLIQDETHDHRNASQHQFWTDNIEFVGYNPLTKPGNAEIQVSDSPDGRTYAYIAGWKGFHIVDVTDPSNTTVTAWYNDPYTQVLDITYLQYNGREYIICQNQIVDSGSADPNVGEWDDPAQVSVNLVDVTDKSDPQWIDSWYDSDHPTGPHNLYTYMIDQEWYLFVTNPDYDDDCYVVLGETCGGVTIAHLNFDLWGDLPRIVKVGEYEISWETTRGGWMYIHDMTVQRWPGIDENDPRFGRTFIYGAYWEAGLRIADVTDVPHPRNDYPNYLVQATGCYSHNPVTCNWRAPEVGYWMDFADLNGDGEPDSSTASNSSSVNGGRASYIHYAEPYPVMVDASHLGMGDVPVHLTFISTEVLETTNGTGLSYLLDTTDYVVVNGNFRFLPKLLSSWENPFGADHHIPGGEEWLLFSPRNSDSVWFDTSGGGDTSHGGTWDGRIYMGNYHSGLWVLDVETLMVGNGYLDNTYREATIGYYLPHGIDGEPMDSQFYDFGWVPFLWTAEYHKGYVYLSCITSGLYIVQLDLDLPYVDTSLAVSEP